MRKNVGTLYSYAAGGFNIRIIHFDYDKAIIFFIRIFSGGKTKYGIEFCHENKFDRDFEGLMSINDIYLIDKPESEISVKDKFRRDQRYDVIKTAIESVDFLYPRMRRKILKEILQNQKQKKLEYEKAGDQSQPRNWFSRSSIMEWIMCWFVGGMSRNSLLTNYENSGGPGKLREPSHEKRGRPRKVSSQNEININSNIRALMRQSVKTYYGQKPESSLHDAYFEMIAFEFVDTPKIPSYNQFRDFYYSSTLREEVERKRAGDVIHMKDKRILTGTSRDRIFGVGSEFQIDNTRDDTHAISIETGNAYIGRLTLYLIVDVFSGMIVGVALLPENASYRSACLALENAGSDKVEFCKKLGIPIKYEEWPCNGLCQNLLGDKGELFSHKADSITNTLRINVENAPSKRPDLKAVVERAIGHFMKELKKTLYKRGLVNKGTRIDKDTRKEAVMNMNDILYIIVKEIIHYNNYTALKDYPLTEEMVTAKVRRTPLGIWTWAANNGLSNLNYFNKDALARNLLEQVSGVSYYQDGFYFKKKYWVPTTEEGKHIWRNLLANKPCKATISYDPFSIEKTYLYHDRKFYPLRLRQNQLPFQSLIETEATLEEFSDQDKCHVDEETQHKAQTIRDQSKKANEARARRTHVNQKIDLKNTRKNRTQEKMRVREKLRNEKPKAPIITSKPKLQSKSGLPSRLSAIKRLSR